MFLRSRVDSVCSRKGPGRCFCSVGASENRTCVPTVSATETPPWVAQVTVFTRRGGCCCCYLHVTVLLKRCVFPTFVLNVSRPWC